MSTMVTEYDWQSDTFTHNADYAARQAFRQAVAEIADKARQTLPECNGRVDSAVKIVLAGDVELLESGKGKVASQSNGTVVYHLVNGECSCKDFAKAPSGWCKHRIAYGLALRVRARLAQGTTNDQAETSANGTAPESPSTPDAPTGKAEGKNGTHPDTDNRYVDSGLTVPALPEAPVSITLKATLHGHEVLVTLRSTDFASVKAQVEQASEWLEAQSGHVADDTPQCPKHGALKPSTKGKGWYCPQKLADGSWCKGK